jgi:hypothetical protein
VIESAGIRSQISHLRLSMSAGPAAPQPVADEVAQCRLSWVRRREREKSISNRATRKKEKKEEAQGSPLRLRRRGIDQRGTRPSRIVGVVLPRA